VAAHAASVISRVPERAADCALAPPSRCRSMFSSTMIASSITTPIASVSPSSVIVLSVKSNTQIRPNVATIDSGIAAATIIVGRKRRMNTNTTSTASTPPNKSAVIVSSNDSRITCVLSRKPSRFAIWMPAGVCARALSMRRTNSSTIATELPFDCLDRPSATPGLPFM
jgi:hypothetical protein